MKTKPILPTLILLTIFLSSCYRSKTFVSNINSDKKTCTLYLWVNKFEPFTTFGGKSVDIYMVAVEQVPLNKLDSMKIDANLKMDSVINFFKNNDVILK